LRDAIFYIDTVEVYELHNMFLDICSEYRLQIESNTQNQISSQDELKSKLYEFVDNGFFISDLLLKLGIIGTVVGFIIMLSSLSAIDEMNLSKMNNLLLSMSAGMKVALYTTLTGLIGSILLTIQYNFFESKINIFINKVLNSKKHEKKE
jgi:flagellar motor component MotA